MLSVRGELADEFAVSFREGAMGMTLSMDPDTRDAVVGKVVEQGQAFRAVRPRGRETGVRACVRSRPQKASTREAPRDDDKVVTKFSSFSCAALAGPIYNFWFGRRRRGSKRMTS